MPCVVLLLASGCVAEGRRDSTHATPMGHDPREQPANRTRVFFFDENGGFTAEFPNARTPREAPFKRYPLGSAADWQHQFLNSTYLVGANATFWVRFDEPVPVHPLSTPIPCPWNLGMELAPFRSGDTIHSSNCSQEPWGLVMPGVYKFAFAFERLSGHPFWLETDRSLRLSLGGGMVEGRQSAKVLMGSPEYPSQIWLTGDSHLPE